ncbi:low affinity immunoglobulin epsilon Fc receptor-like isoform X1 [Epinephelus fuscoguttatus]|uniref:low affinity immunoglobulin epsilon Fc receptor-like isoform X1 n=1 Tax=Epinephelus fuscoguttatus TaxID=293821 RepID=UPI0020D121AC|nr:low affinity immunoglobulin epsilon Fc receptor-like isoform X1 [Epinephelus fuscoguttatus]
MRVIFLLCATFTLRISTADPVKEMKPEPVEEPVPVQQNKTGEEKRGELLSRGAGRMAKWQYGGINRFPDYYSGEDDCPASWQRYGSRCFVFINSPMAWVDAEKHCWPYGANLASIHDQWEYSFIQDSVIDQGYYGQAWIGGTDAVRPMDSLWSDGSVSDVESWAASTWDRRKKCLAIRRSDLLNKWYCEDMLPFVCGTRPGTFEKVEAVPVVEKQEESKMPDDDKQSWHSCPASWSKYGSRCFTVIPREMPWIDAEIDPDTAHIYILYVCVHVELYLLFTGIFFE